MHSFENVKEAHLIYKKHKPHWLCVRLTKQELLLVETTKESEHIVFVECLKEQFSVQ